MQKFWRETIFFHGLKASFTFLLSHTYIFFKDPFVFMSIVVSFVQNM